MQNIAFDGNQLPFDQADLGQLISKILCQNAPLKGKLKGVRTKRRKSEKVLKVENIKMALTSTKLQKK